MTQKTQKPNIVMVIAAIAVQLLLVLVLFLTNFIVVADSQEIALKLKPVDPRDPFRGDYLVLNYDISTIETNNYNNPETFNTGDTVYIGLNLNTPEFGSKTPSAYFASNGIYATKPILDPKKGFYGPDQVSFNPTMFIKGTIGSSSLYDRNATYNSNQNEPYMPMPYQKVDKYTINYGIEQYFIPEGSGSSSDLNSKNAHGIAKVNRTTGEARIDRIEIEGKKWPK